jgi:hypothetical protein
VARAEAGRLKNVMAPRSTMIGFKPLPTRAGLARRSELGAYLGPVEELGSGGTFEALPTPLGSLTELLFPPAFPGPAGTPLTPVVPEPAEPAGGVLVGLPEAAPAVDPLAAPPAPCARAAIGSIRLAAAAIAIRFDFFDMVSSTLLIGSTGVTRGLFPLPEPLIRWPFATMGQGQERIPHKSSADILQKLSTGLERDCKSTFLQ